MKEHSQLEEMRAAIRGEWERARERRYAEAPALAVEPRIEPVAEPEPQWEPAAEPEPEPEPPLAAEAEPEVRAPSVLRRLAGLFRRR